MELIARPNGNYFPEQTLYFVDPERGLERPLCDVSNCVMSNTPYAPDENYFYSSRLYEEAGALWVEVLQSQVTSQAGASPTVTRTVLRSADRGATWEKQGG
jgi:hypothetical protein